MDWTFIIGAIIAAAGTFAGSLYGIHKANSVVDFRLDELTREVREHNNYAKRMPVVEEKIKVINHRIDDLESKAEK